ncbi:MAG TPA: hypothetical protein VGK61_09180 [Planctomycetota bacterium]|jgi:hypothetical protein
MTWRRLALVDGALLALAILASRAALLLHEVVGHGLIAAALGARSVTLKLSLFGGGGVTPSGFDPSPAGYVLFSLGGIAVNLLTGAAAWIVARRLKRRGLPYVFLLMLGAGSVGQALFYLANGFFYGEGDPTGFVGRGGDLAPYQWMWALFVLPFAATAGLAARGYLDFLAGHAPVETPRRRLGWTAATVGVATLAYLGLWAATWNSRVDVSLRRLRVNTEIARESARRPPPPPGPVVPTPAPPAPAVTEEEVAPRVPPPVAAVTMLAAGLIAAGLVLWRAKPVAEPAELRPWPVAVAGSLAAAAIATIALLGK